MHLRRVHFLVPLQGGFKWDNGYKWHRLPFVDVTRSGLEVRKLVWSWFSVIVK